MTAIIYWQDNIAQCSLPAWTLGSEGLSLNVYPPLCCEISGKSLNLPDLQVPYLSNGLLRRIS